MQFCADNFLSESVLEAVQAGRADFAGTLVDMGLLPASYPACLQRPGQPSSAQQELHAFDQFCDNARVVKAALCAGAKPLPHAFSAYTPGSNMSMPICLGAAMPNQASHETDLQTRAHAPTQARTHRRVLYKTDIRCLRQAPTSSSVLAASGCGLSVAFAACYGPLKRQTHACDPVPACRLLSLHPAG